MKATVEPPENRAAPSSSRGLLRYVVSIVLSAFLVAWLLRDLGVEPIVRTLRDAYLPGVAMGSAAFLAMVAARVARYRVLLQTRVPLVPLTLITLVRGMLGDLLPARLGTLSYVWLVTRRAGVPLDDALASFLLAFVLDMVAIAPLLLLAFAVVGLGMTGAPALVGLSLLLLLGSIVTTLLLAPGLRFAAGLASRVPSGWISERASRTLADTADRVAEVRGRGALLPALAWSMVVRLTKFGAHWLFLQAVLVPLGVPWGELGFFRAFLGVAGAEMSAMLPISGIAALGTWEMAWTMGFTRLGLTEQQAVLSGFATHVLSQLHDYVLGIGALLGLLLPGLRTGQAGAHATEGSSRTPPDSR